MREASRGVWERYELSIEAADTMLLPRERTIFETTGGEVSEESIGSSFGDLLFRKAEEIRERPDTAANRDDADAKRGERLLNFDTIDVDAVESFDVVLKSMLTPPTSIGDAASKSAATEPSMTWERDREGDLPRAR